jgi:hypothetical protein
MRPLRTRCILGLTLGLFAALVSAQEKGLIDDRSALHKDPSGWIDLLAGKDLKNWKRVSIPPDSKLNTKDPWRLDPKTHSLVCDGVGVHEMLLYNEEFADGTLHVEWRFKKIDGKKGYNSGVYARTSGDGAIWHQAQVGENIGYIFGDTLVDGKTKRIKIDDKQPQRGKEAGQWNTYEVTCKGKQMSLWINGAITATWENCEVPKGHVGLEAEYWYLEFRNVKFKP